MSTPRAASAAAGSARHPSRDQGRFAPGETLGGRYRIVALLGKGGMGEVYRADDLVLDQPVALKFLPEASLTTPRPSHDFVTRSASPADAWTRRWPDWTPDTDNLATLTGPRGPLALLFTGLPHAVRDALFFLLVIFLLRAVLRSQWLAAAGWVIFSVLNLGSAQHPWFTLTVNFVVLFGIGVVMFRWGLLAASVVLLFGNLTNVPAAPPSAWYFANSALLIALALAIAVWAFHTSLGGRKLWKEDFFG